MTSSSIHVYALLVNIWLKFLFRIIFFLLLLLIPPSVCNFSFSADDVIKVASSCD